LVVICDYKFASVYYNVTISESLEVICDYKFVSAYYNAVIWLVEISLTYYYVYNYYVYKVFIYWAY